MRALTAIAAAALLLGFFAFGDPWADIVVDTDLGPGAGFGVADHMLDAPEGGDFFVPGTDVYTLGVQGSVVLHLESGCFDGPGTDLIVSENPFYILDTMSSFAEAMYVEVSNDGDDWVRFPTSYSGPVGPFPANSGGDPAWYRGFAGALPVLSNPSNTVASTDVVHAGGDAFDLADLPETVGLVNYVRLVDVESGVDTDTGGTVVWDFGLDAFASADVDAVTAVNNLESAISGKPEVEMSLDAGFLTIEFHDPNGLNDIKFGLEASANGYDVDFYELLSFFLITEKTSKGFTIVTGPIPAGFFPVVFRVGAVDQSGKRSGDSVTIQ